MVLITLVILSYCTCTRICWYELIFIACILHCVHVILHCLYIALIVYTCNIVRIPPSIITILKKRYILQSVIFYTATCIIHVYDMFTLNKYNVVSQPYRNINITLYITRCPTSNIRYAISHHIIIHQCNIIVHACYTANIWLMVCYCMLLCVSVCYCGDLCQCYMMYNIPLHQCWFNVDDTSHIYLTIQCYYCRVLGYVIKLCSGWWWWCILFVLATI